MPDSSTFKVVKTKDTFEHETYEELLSLDLSGPDYDDNLYKHTALKLLAEHNIYAWRVEDRKTLINTGASAEFQQVIIFLAGAGAMAFTGEVVKRLAALLESVARKAFSAESEMDDLAALSTATLYRRSVDEHAQLVEMKRTETGNRVFRFVDGAEIELDKHGILVRQSAWRADQTLNQ